MRTYQNLAAVGDRLEIEQCTRVVAVQLACVRPVLDRVLRADDVRRPFEAVLAVVVHFAQDRIALQSGGTPIDQ